MHIELVPLKKVGVFIFNDDIRNYSDYGLKIERSLDKTGWDTYRLEKDGVIIHTENNLIVSIACYNYCYLKNQNVINMKVGDFVNLNKVYPDLNQTDTIFLNEEEYPHIVYEFETLGMQIWVKKGVIDTVFCAPLIEE